MVKIFSSNDLYLILHYTLKLMRVLRIDLIQANVVEPRSSWCSPTGVTRTSCWTITLDCNLVRVTCLTWPSVSHMAGRWPQINTVNIYLGLVKKLSFFKGYFKISSVNNDKNTIIQLKAKSTGKGGFLKNNYSKWLIYIVLPMS